MQFRGWTGISTILASIALIALPVGAAAQDKQVVSPVKTQIEASDAVRRRVDRYFMEAVKKQKDGCDLYETTITELEYFSTEKGVYASADTEYGQPVAFSQDFMESLKDYAKFRLKEFKEVCAPPTETRTAQRQESGSPSEEADPAPFAPPGGLRMQLGGFDGGMTSIDPPAGKEPAPAKDAIAEAVGTGKLITTLQGPGGRPVIIVEDPDGRRWISTNLGETKHYMEPEQAPGRQAKAGAPLMHRRDMSGGVKQPANALQAGGSAQKKDAVTKAQEAVEESNREIGTIQRELREMSGTEKPKDAIIATQGRVYELDGMIESLEGSLQRMGVSQQELKELKEEYAKTPLLKQEDADTNFFTRVLPARHQPIADAIATAITVGGRKIIKSINTSRLEEAVRRGDVQLRDAHGLLRDRYVEIGQEKQKLHDLKALDKKLTDAFNDRARAQANLDEETKRHELFSGSTASKAMLGREMDNPGDAQLQKESDRDRSRAAVKEGIKLAPGEKPMTSKSPTITNKKQTSTATKSAPAKSAKSAPVQNNELGQQIGQQILQGVIQGGIQYGLGRIGSGGHREPSREAAPATRSGSGQMVKSPGTTMTKSAPVAPAAPSGTYTVFGITGPGR